MGQDTTGVYLSLAMLLYEASPANSPQRSLVQFPGAYPSNLAGICLFESVIMFPPSDVLKATLTCLQSPTLASYFLMMYNSVARLL
jgi:hypothetical protein